MSMCSSIHSTAIFWICKGLGTSADILGRLSAQKCAMAKQWFMEDVWLVFSHAERAYLWL